MPNTPGHDLEAISTSIGRIWEGFVNVERNQERITTVLESLTETIKDIRADLTDVEKVVHERSRTQWGVIFGTVSAATAFLTIVGGIVAYAWISDIRQVSDEVTQLRANVNEHVQAAGHPWSVLEKVESLKERYEARMTLILKDQDVLRNDIQYLRERLDQK